MNWYKCSSKKKDEGKKTLKEYRDEFIERMKSIGLTDEEIERALKSGYLERIMQGRKHKS